MVNVKIDEAELRRATENVDRIANKEKELFDIPGVGLGQTALQRDAEVAKKWGPVMQGLRANPTPPRHALHRTIQNSIDFTPQEGDAPTNGTHSGLRCR